MNYTDTSIAHLEAISRSRDLTEAESAELYRLVRQEQMNANRRRRYRNDPEYRAAMKLRGRMFRRGEAGRQALGLREAAALRQRDASGRFV